MSTTSFVLRTRITTGFCAILFSAFLSFGQRVLHPEVIDYNFLFFAGFLFGAAILYPALLLLWKFCDWSETQSKQKKEQTSLAAKAERLLSNSKIWYLFCIVMLVIWSPVLFAAWPGFFMYDAYQAYAGFVNGSIDPNQPLLHTILLSVSLELGNSFFESYNLGIAAFVGISSVFVSVVLIAALKHIYILGASPVLVFGSLCYYSLSPIIAMFSFCTTKDVLFSALLVLLFLRIMAVVKDPQLLQSKKTLIFNSFIVFLLLAFRSNALFALLLSMPIVVYLCVGFRREMLLTLMSGIVLFALWSGPIASRFPINRSLNGSALLMASVPTSQIARLWNSEVISETDRKEIERVFAVARF